jgi:hypothetical protein
MSKLILLLYYLHQLPDLALDAASPGYVVVYFLTHNRYLKEVSVLAEEICRLKEVVPALVTLVDFLNELAGCSEVLFGDVAGYFGYVVSCVHVWCQGGEYDHLAVDPVNVLHLLDHNRDGPDPVGVDEEEPVQ